MIFPLIKGNRQTALRSKDEIIISESLARKFFGDDWKNNPDIIGQTFSLSDQDNFKLAGVSKDVDAGSSIRFDVLLPIEYYLQDEQSNRWNSNNYHTYLLLKKGSDANAFGKKIENQLHSYLPETNALLQLQPFSKQYLYSSFDFQTDWGYRSNIKYIRIFSGVGLLLLLIACINFVNLSTARSLKRALEVGVRKVTGASKRQLVAQFLVESVLVASIAGIAASLLIKSVQPYLLNLVGYELNIDFTSLSFVTLFLSLHPDHRHYCRFISCIYSLGFQTHYCLKEQKQWNIRQAFPAGTGHFSVCNICYADHLYHFYVPAADFHPAKRSRL